MDENIKILTDRSDIVAIADAVRSKTGTTREMTLGGIITGIHGISVSGTEDLDAELNEQDSLITQLEATVASKASGGGGGATGSVIIEPLSVTKNGTYTASDDVDGYSPVVVNIQPILQNKTVTPTTSAQTITADNNYDGLDTVIVNSIPSEYIIPSGSLPITENGAHDVTAYASVSVNVAGGAGGDDGESSTALLDAALNGSLTSIDSTVTSVVAYACRGLSKIKTVNLPNTTSIGTYAFYYCTSMTTLYSPQVTTLNTYGFYNCSKLPSVDFPLATSIPSNCFYSCGALAKADFGAAKSIAASAFAYCSALSTLILRRTDAICTLANTTNALKDTPIENGTGYVYVPSALIDTYKSATNWSTYANQFRAIEDYPDICG